MGPMVSRGSSFKVIRSALSRLKAEPVLPPKSNVDKLGAYGLKPELTTGGFSQLAFLKTCLVVASKAQRTLPVGSCFATKPDQFLAI